MDISTSSKENGVKNKKKRKKVKKQSRFGRGGNSKGNPKVGCRDVTVWGEGVP